MKIGDEVYNKHFRDMVLEAQCCGLSHPVEWVEGYSRGVGIRYEDIPEIEAFCNLAIKDLYAMTWCVDLDKVSMDDCNNWIDNHYNQKR